METHFGWVENKEEVAKCMAAMQMPELKGNGPILDEKKEVFLYKPVREILGKDAPKGPQGIGDCVSWGWGNHTNYSQCIRIYQQLKKENLLSLPPRDECTEADYDRLQKAKLAVLEEYQECATEATYALSRVEVGGQRGSYSDGSVGAWAARAATLWGHISRPYLEKKYGPGKGKYDKNRAKEWGAKGLPDDIEPEAKLHLFQTTTLVRTFAEAAALIQNGYGVVVCSNRGFRMTRDSQGFCAPSGVWYHCMYLMAVRWDRPGLCCSQSWGGMVPDGPLDKDQPDNSFWIDANVIDYMLRQEDSFTASEFQGYPAQDIVDWKH
jgi:hypothetical protein